MQLLQKKQGMSDFLCMADWTALPVLQKRPPSLWLLSISALSAGVVVGYFIVSSRRVKVRVSITPSNDESTGRWKYVMLMLM